jgi:uridine phosphorylase
VEDILMGKLYHIGLDENMQIGYALLTGDPQRVEKIAEYLTNPRFEACNREYKTYSGTIDGVKVLVTSTGIGGASAAIAVEELHMAGVHTFIRIGTCGGMQLDVNNGSLIIPTAAIRMEGTSKEYMPIEFPAVADFEIVSALKEAAKKSENEYHIGIIQSKDSFYGQHSPERMPVGQELMQKWKAWVMGGCLASEMECAAIFTVASVLKARAGAVLLSIWNREKEKVGCENTMYSETTQAIKTAVEAMRILINSNDESM